MGCNARYNLSFAKKVIQIIYPDLLKNNYIKILFKLKPTNGGCFQRPMVGPGCLNPPVQKGCNVPLGSEPFYPNELELHSQLCHSCTATSALHSTRAPLLFCTNDKTSTAHIALCSPTATEEGKGITQCIESGARQPGW